MVYVLRAISDDALDVKVQYEIGYLLLRSLYLQRLVDNASCPLTNMSFPRDSTRPCYQLRRASVVILSCTPSHPRWSVSLSLPYDMTVLLYDSHITLSSYHVILLSLTLLTDRCSKAACRVQKSHSAMYPGNMNVDHLRGR
jgi:hypothetical protein